MSPLAIGTGKRHATRARLGVRYHRGALPGEVLMLDAGLAVASLGLLAVIRPVARAGLGTRRRGLFLLVAGFCVAWVAALLPVRPLTLGGPPMLFDAVLPVYDFGEAHETRVRAPRESVWRAIQEVTADEIRFFRVLTWLRAPRLRDAPRGILNPGRGPILESAAASGFVELRRAENTELVVGTVVCCGALEARTAAAFDQLDDPAAVRAAMNFHVAQEGDAVRLRTETRVRGGSPAATLRFAPYWRVIYPGSAFIRRMWLDAIRRRAEGAS